MPKPLKKQFYFMSPVQVVKVTTHNIEQAAEWCGGVIKTTESRRYPNRTDKYIEVPVPKGASIVMAFPGMYITKRVVVSLEDELKISFAVFRRDYFEKNYFLEPVQSVDACWVRLANEELPVEQAIAHVNVANPGDVGKALNEARKKMVQAGVPAAVADTVTEDLTAAVVEELEDNNLTPAQQRMLITGDEVEKKTNPETGNVVLPRGAAAAHPTQRALRKPKEKSGDILDPNDPALYVHDYTNPIIKGEDFDGDTPIVIDDNITGPTVEEVLNATQEIAGEPATSGELVDSAIVGSAAGYRHFLATGEAPSEGWEGPQSVADKAAFDEEMKALENGNPDQ